jgi:hypothetical protein
MATTFATAGTTGGGMTALSLAKAPWWVIAVVAGGGLLLGILQTLLLGILQTVIPQESGDRLEWWQSLWDHRERRTKHPQTNTAAPGRSSPPADPRALSACLAP